MQVSDYVLVADPNPVRAKWTEGWVTQVYPSPADGRVRNAIVKTNSGENQRTITKLCVQGDPKN